VKGSFDPGHRIDVCVRPEPGAEDTNEEAFGRALGTLAAFARARGVTPAEWQDAANTAFVKAPGAPKAKKKGAPQ